MCALTFPILFTWQRYIRNIKLSEEITCLLKMDARVPGTFSSSVQGPADIPRRHSDVAIYDMSGNTILVSRKHFTNLPFNKLKCGRYECLSRACRIILHTCLQEGKVIFFGVLYHFSTSAVNRDYMREKQLWLRECKHDFIVISCPS